MIPVHGVRPPLHPFFRIVPFDPPANGAWVTYLGGEPAACHHGRVDCRDMSGGGGFLVGDFPNILHRLRHRSLGSVFTLDVERQAAKALGVRWLQTVPDEVSCAAHVQAGHSSAPAHR